MPYAPDAGDLIWTDFDPRVGREQSAPVSYAGKVPAAALDDVRSKLVALKGI